LDAIINFFQRIHTPTIFLTLRPDMVDYIETFGGDHLDSGQDRQDMGMSSRYSPRTCTIWR
jgi:hypothetical protein